MSGKCICVPDCTGKECGTDGCGGDCGGCDDGSACTVDKCVDHVCQHDDQCCVTGQDCNDDDDCTEDSCIAGMCKFAPTGAPGCCVAPLFADDFSGDKGWDYGPEWERGPAQVSSGQVSGNPDPGSDHTGSNDNHLAGVKIGGNAAKTIHDFYWLTSPQIDVSGADNLTVTYWRWLNSDYLPYMQNKVEVWNGDNWNQIWATGSSPGIKDATWAFASHNVAQFANAEFRVRFGFNIGSGGVFAISGWNLDDVTILDLPEGGLGMCCQWDSDCDGFFATCGGNGCQK